LFRISLQDILISHRQKGKQNVAKIDEKELLFSQILPFINDLAITINGSKPKMTAQGKLQKKVQRPVKNDEAEIAQTVNHPRKTAYIAMIHFLTPKQVNVQCKGLLQATYLWSVQFKFVN
jgi:hypothetical protein